MKLGQPIGGASTPLHVIGAQLARTYSQNGNSILAQSVKETAGRVIAMESAQINDAEIKDIQHELDNLSVSLEQYASEANVKFSKAQLDAAQSAGMLTMDLASYFAAPVTGRGIALESGVNFIPSIGGGGMEARVAIEAYSDADNRNIAVNSVLFNLGAARQDAFGEAFFPTVVVPNDHVGYGVSIQLIQVQEDIRRQISGVSAKNFNRKNIVFALSDATILMNDTTRGFPVFRDESKQFFLPEALKPSYVRSHEGQAISTSALAVGKKVQLLGISQTQALIDTGLMDVTDALDPAVTLEAAYIKIGTELFKFGHLDQMQSATWTPSVQGLSQQMSLVFETAALLFTKETKTDAGTDSVVLDALVSGEYVVRVGLTAYGKLNLETTDAEVTPGSVTVLSVETKDGVPLPLDAGNGKLIADLFVDAEMVGYDLIFRRINRNARERGQLIDLQEFKQVYEVPLLSPVTSLRPIGSSGATDASDIAGLITATYVRISNAAVTKLLSTLETLAQYVAFNGGQRDHTIDTGLFGLGRFVTNPFFESHKLDFALNDVIDSIKSHERAADLQAVLVNKLRDIAYRMYRDSNYKPAADALAGGIATKPTLIVGCDPTLARYLQVSGDFRTIGDGFDIMIVDTQDTRMRGKIVLAFGNFNEVANGSQNILHFGHMAWKAEIPTVLPLHRNGANSKELTVQPSFLHVVNTPIAALIEVKGISEVVAGKVPVWFHTV